jgi:hypothetical protein
VCVDAIISSSTRTLSPPLFPLYAMPPSELTAGTTRRADKEGGGHLDQGEELSVLAVIPRRPRTRFACPPPPPPTPCRWGPRSRLQTVSASAASDGSMPWVVVGSCMQLGCPIGRRRDGLRMRWSLLGDWRWHVTGRR